MKLSELYNQLAESKRTEGEALKILKYFHQKINAEYPTEHNIPSEDFIMGELNSFKEIDTTESKNNIGPMAYFYAQSLWPSQDLIHYPHLKEIFEDYNELFNSGKLGRIEVSPSGVRIIGKGEGEWDDFMDFQEYIHGQKNLYAPKAERSGELVVDIDEPALFDNNGIEIYDATDVNKCIKYGYTSQIASGKKPYSFCISNPKMGSNMYQSYRDTQGSTFYFIFDKNRREHDPLHIVVFDSGSRGVKLTDADNNTGRISEYGENVKGYIGYLESKGVPVEEMMPNIPHSDEEKEEAKLLGRQNKSLEWFQKLSYEYKQKYIGRGHWLTDKQLRYILPNKELTSKYLQLGHEISEDVFDLITNNNIKKTYIRSRINYWEGRLKEFYREGHNNEGLGNYKLEPWELKYVPQDKVDAWAELSVKNRWPIFGDELDLVSDGLREKLKGWYYKQLATEGNFWIMIGDSDITWENKKEILELAFDRFSRKIERQHLMTMDEDENVTLNVSEEELDYIIRLAIEKKLEISFSLVPKHLKKEYIEMIAKFGRHIPDEGVYDKLLSGGVNFNQAEVDHYVKHVGSRFLNSNNNVVKKKFHKLLSRASQPYVDYLLNSYLDSANKTHKSVGGAYPIPTNVVSLASPKFQETHKRMVDGQVASKLKDGKDILDIGSRFISNASSQYKEKFIDEYFDKVFTRLMKYKELEPDLINKFTEHSVTLLVESLGEIVSSLDEASRDGFYKRLYIALKGLEIKMGRNAELFELLEDYPSKWGEKIKSLYHPF
jgi:hypothetical protein